MDSNSCSSITVVLRAEQPSLLDNGDFGCVHYVNTVKSQPFDDCRSARFLMRVNLGFRMHQCKSGFDDAAESFLLSASVQSLTYKQTVSYQRNSSFIPSSEKD